MLVNSAQVKPHGVVANVVDFDIVVSEFKPQSWDYIHFLTNALGKGVNSLSPNYGLNTGMALALNNPWKLICHKMDKKSVKCSVCFS